MSTLDYLDEATGTVRYSYVPWGVLNGWLSSLNGNGHETKVPPEGASRAKLIDELRLRRKLNPKSVTSFLQKGLLRNDLGYSKDWREYENNQGYTHLEELLIYQPQDWRKQAREYLLRFDYPIIRRSTNTEKRVVNVLLMDEDDIEHHVPIQLLSPVHTILFHEEVSRPSRYEPLLFVLSWGATSPLEDVKRDIEKYLQQKELPMEKLENLFEEMIMELSPLDYFFQFQEVVEMYGVKKLREAAIKCNFPRLLLMRELDFANIIGQRLAKNMIREAVVRYIMAREEKGPFASKARPLSMIFAGPSGNGKTEMAEWLATLMNKPEDNLFHKVDCAQLTDARELFGMSGPFQGAKEGSTLNNFVQSVSDKKGAIGVVLLDEIEKAGRDVVHGLYQVIDKGEWTDKRLEEGKGSQTDTISCRDIIFIMTTNAADSAIVDLAKANDHIFAASSREFDTLKMTFETKIRKVLQRNYIFDKAFMGRIGSVVPFFPMSNGDPEKCLLSAETTVITKYFIEREQANLEVEQIMDPETKSDIADIIVRSTIEEAGARGIEHLVKKHISNRVLHSYLKEKDGIEKSCILTFTADRDHGITDFRVSELGQSSSQMKQKSGEWAEGAFD